MKHVARSLFRSSALLLASCFLLLTSPSARADDPIPPQVSTAVDRGLEWLAAQQNPATGGWDSGGNNANSSAVTSLAVMAFMARGHVPGQGPYGERLNHAIDYVLSQQQPSGLLASRRLDQSMYDHGISTVMLCEVYGMLDDQRQEQAQAAIGHAVSLILAAQSIRKDPNSQGGWRYKPNSTDSDLSVTGWQLMALRGAANVGANVPLPAISSGIAYVKRRNTSSGGFAYTGNNGANSALTGTGILALMLLGQYDAPQVKSGGDFLVRTTLGRDLAVQGHYFYTVYYCAQAAYQLGGRYWEAIDPPIRDSILQHQERDGSWSVTAGEHAGGDSYATSMAILALTVPYRYLPIYQR